MKFLCSSESSDPVVFENGITSSPSSFQREVIAIFPLDTLYVFVFDIVKLIVLNCVKARGKRGWDWSLTTVHLRLYIVRQSAFSTAQHHWYSQRWGWICHSLLRGWSSWHWTAAWGRWTCRPQCRWRHCRSACHSRSYCDNYPEKQTEVLNYSSTLL